MTLGDVVRMIFPRGTRPPLGIVPVKTEQAAPWAEWELAPLTAADNFAFAAYTINLVGLMGYFDPHPEAKAANANNTPMIVLSEDDRKACDEASALWLQTGLEQNKTFLPAALHQAWKEIMDHRTTAIRLATVYDEAQPVPIRKPHPAPTWWTALFKIVRIADEASEGLGYEIVPHDVPVEDLKLPFDAHLWEFRINEKPPGQTSKGDPVPRRELASIAYAANRQIVSVQPKGRVAQVGCSVRNLSRNLALVGPSGNVRCFWHPLPDRADPNQRGKPLNVLIVPLPLQLFAKDFQPVNQQVDRAEHPRSWANFRIVQNWLPANDVETERFIAGVLDLILRAKEDSGIVDALVFPEFAMTFTLFERLMKAVTKHRALNSEIKFVISGSSNNCSKEAANVVLCAVNDQALCERREQDAGSNGPLSSYTMSSQGKHHRWKLSADQISTYGLGAALNPACDWWEDHQICKRQLHIHQLRRDTIITALICEDLARNDPVHDIMRSVAPNILFALLMDGPQLSTRWPARYAATLADDPGTMVVTVTSRGLVERSNRQSPEWKSHSIGLIRDGRGVTKELTLPDGHQAVLLTLGESRIVDHTIDGRKTRNASEWFYVSQIPVKSQSDWWTKGRSANATPHVAPS